MVLAPRKRDVLQFHGCSDGAGETSKVVDCSQTIHRTRLIHNGNVHRGMFYALFSGKSW